MHRDKPLHLDAALEHVSADVRARIVRLIVADMPDSDDAWVLEHWQRDALSRGLGASACCSLAQSQARPPDPEHTRACTRERCCWCWWVCGEREMKAVGWRGLQLDGAGLSGWGRRGGWAGPGARERRRRDPGAARGERHRCSKPRDRGRQTAGRANTPPMRWSVQQAGRTRCKQLTRKVPTCASV